ncbi:MAG: hypothetical protein H6748_12675 [Spirochaetaceae bacterium]|nr:hypothetical protein [Myxococcales bacterium]MCB9724896.1 hypothetical protein [Spirochaetaceae bacterium]HPG27902.1 hypothetical protein [Myxococcota bacterium]
MSTEETLRIAKSPEALDALLDRIESGELAKPDWIRIQGSCRLDRMKPEMRAARLARIHGCVLRGFKNACAKPGTRKARLELWKSIARSGFHDFSEFGWTKNYDSPFVEDYDYVSAYEKGGLAALDPYAVYSAVLGTFDFGVADFVSTKLCRDVRTIVEPMAGTAEFCYAGHFRYPDFHYLMIDLDREAQALVLEQPWLPDAQKDYIIGDVLSKPVWERVKSQSSGDSLAYIGKQSHHYFSAKQLLDLMKVATDHVDFLMLETPQICLVSDMGDTDELTRGEQKDAGFKCELVGEEGGEPNPLTHHLSFRLQARDAKGTRTLFEYHDWTSWSHSTLVAFADLLDLKAFYYHSEEEEFFPVSRWDEDADCEENVTFMLFTRRNV